MNKQSIFNIIFAIGIAVILGIQLTSGNEAKGDDKDSEKAEIRSELNGDGTYKIGFIRTDSLLTTYERHKELQKELEGKMKIMEREWERKTRVFQENLKVLEEEAPRMSERELQMAQQELEMKQQELMAWRERKSQEFMGEERELNRGLYEEVTDAINRVQEKLNLDMVFMLELGGSLVWANDAFDITDEMAEELNARHRKEKEGNKKEEGKKKK
ncbi:MAG: OmpH family outer membrane protein [Cryomorphaceae bacterium]|nr:OmpH family outer membrane protein [Cryomorphaceae bacterium]